MFDLDRWQEIWVTITHNKSRSFLTAFGVFWGMFMLVVMVGAGNGLATGINSQIEGFASNSVFFSASKTSLPYKGFEKDRSWDMLNSDIPIIEERVKGLQHISPILFRRGGNTDNIVRNEKSGSFLVKGTYPVQDKIEKSIMEHGRYINDIDIIQYRKVCVLGTRIYEVLFRTGEDPVGQQVRINGIYFTVVGVARKTSIFNDTAATEIDPLALHGALAICLAEVGHAEVGPVEVGPVEVGLLTTRLTA